MFIIGCSQLHLSQLLGWGENIHHCYSHTEIYVIFLKHHNPPLTKEGLDSWEEMKVNFPSHLLQPWYNQHHMHYTRSQTLAMFITTCSFSILVPLTAQQPLFLHPTVFNLLEHFRAGMGEIASQTCFQDHCHIPHLEKESAVSHYPICFSGIRKRTSQWDAISSLLASTWIWKELLMAPALQAL